MGPRAAPVSHSNLLRCDWLENESLYERDLLISVTFKCLGIIKSFIPRLSVAANV